MPFFSDRYRYPIYTSKRPSLDDTDGDQAGGEDYYLSKRFLSGLGLRALSPRNKKQLFSPLSRYNLNDLTLIEKMLQEDRRKRTPDLYDLKQLHKVYTSGRKRSLSSSEDDVRKRSGDFTHDVWDMARMEDYGKRSPVTGYYDLLDLSKLAKAGKRSGVDGYSLWQLAQLQDAGKKRSGISDYDLLSLARIAESGKRSGSHLVGPFGSGRLDDLGGGDDEEDDGGDAEQVVAKKKRSLDDYIGWDRKKKSVSEDAMLNSYLNTMEDEVMGHKEKRSTSDDMAAAEKKEQQGESISMSTL